MAEDAVGGGGEPSAPEVRVDASGAAVDSEAVKGAVERELSRSGLPRNVQARVQVRLAPDRQLTVVYQNGRGDELSRTVTAPERDAELPEVAALLASNMARDEAGGFLSSLDPAPAVPAAEPAPVELEPRRRLEGGGVNLSLFYPMTLRGNTEERRFNFEFGLFYSRIGALSGVAINAGGVSHVVDDAHGLQLAGLGYVQGGPGTGVRIGGVFGVGDERFDGGSLAGLALVQRGDVGGVMVSGAANVATGELEGAQLGGAYNQARGAQGLQVGGAANLSLGALEGAQLGGALNVSDGGTGVQIAGAVNVASSEIDGAQLAGGVNWASELAGAQIAIINVGGDVSGLQLGVINIARDVKGVQLGVVNVAREVDGVTFGVVPYQQRGKTQAVAWFDTKSPFNVGIRFLNGPLYVMPMLSYVPRDGTFDIESGGASYAPGISIGFRLPLGRLHLDLDVNQSAPSDGWAYDEHVVDLRYRGLAGYQLLDNLAIFAGGGVRHHFRTQGPSESAVDPVFSVGLALL